MHCVLSQTWSPESSNCSTLHMKPYQGDAVQSVGLLNVVPLIVLVVEGRAEVEHGFKFELCDTSLNVKF